MRSIRAGQRRRGQGLVEFALALPLLALLLAGLVDFGFLLYAHVQVTNAAREGARAGSLYLGSRMQYSACTGTPVSCPAGYGNGGDCWSLTAWVQNGIVQRNRSNNGCPAATFNTAVSSLGLLNATRCANGSVLNEECWWETITPTPGTSQPIAGSEITVQVRYNHRVLFFGGLMGMLDEYVQITKQTQMMVQNN